METAQPPICSDLGFAMFLIVAVGATLAGFQAWRRGSFDRRIAIVSFALLALASVCSWAWGMKRDELSIALASGDEGVGLVFRGALTLAWVAWILAAAEARAQRFATSTWASLRMAGRAVGRRQRVARGGDRLWVRAPC